MNYQISVLISTYNNERYVEKKLAEVKKQTIFDQVEFIFIETASPEKERVLLEPFVQEHPNCKLIALDERKTLYEAWNIGWDAASAPLVCYTNMDDCMHPCLLEYVVRAMNRKPWDACSVLIAKQMLEDETWNDWSVDRVKRLPLGLRPGPFSVWRNQLKETIGQFEGRCVVAGDKDFWARMVAENLKLGLVKKVLYLYTKDPENQLSKSEAGQKRLREDRELLAQRTYPIQWSYKMRWQIFFLRYLLSIFPGLITVKPPSDK